MVAGGLEGMAFVAVAGPGAGSGPVLFAECWAAGKGWFVSVGSGANAALAAVGGRVGRKVSFVRIGSGGKARPFVLDDCVDTGRLFEPIAGSTMPRGAVAVGMSAGSKWLV